VPPVAVEVVAPLEVAVGVAVEVWVLLRVLVLVVVRVLVSVLVLVLPTALSLVAVPPELLVTVSAASAAPHENMAEMANATKVLFIADSLSIEFEAFSVRGNHAVPQWPPRPHCWFSDASHP
jgi:hypothetical protein